MAELTPGDVLSWDPSIIDQIFQSVSGLHTAHRNLGDGLSDAQRRVADGWHGDGADAFHADLGRQLADIDQSSQEANGVATAVRHAETDVRRCHDTMQQIDTQARSNGWAVNDDWTITAAGNIPRGKEADLAGLRAQLGQLKVDAITADQELALAVRAAVTDLRVDADGHEIPGSGDQPPADPTIDGPGSDPQLEQEQYDLGATIPNDPAVLLPGDPDAARNGLTFADGGRPLPTGTAVGPNGKQYGFFSNAHGDQYVSAQSTVVDLANPSQSLGALADSSGTGIGQASGVYDPATNTMWIAGNANGTGARGLWQSAPIDSSDPNGWIATLRSRGYFAPDNNMFGNRENQLVALPRGGFLLTGAADGRDVYGATASSPGGLLTAPSQSLVGPIASPLPGQQAGVPYGPTIVKTEVLPNGQERITMRISTWDAPVGYKPAPGVPLPPYAPRTYTTTFTITP